MSIDPYKDERDANNDSPFNQGNNDDLNHGVLSPEQKDKNKQDQKNRKGEQRRKEQRMAGGDDFNRKISGAGLQDATLKGKYTKREIREEMKSGNMTADDYQKLQDSGQQFNGKAQDFLAKKFDMNFGNSGSSSGGGDNSNGNGNGGGSGGNGGGGNSGGGVSDEIQELGKTDYRTLNREIHESPLYQYAKADMMKSNIFGDMWTNGYGGTWRADRSNRNNDNDSGRNNDDD